MKNRKTKKKNQPKRWVLISTVVFTLAVLGTGGAVWHHHLQTTAQNKTFQDTQSIFSVLMDEVSVEIPGGRRVGEAYCGRNSVKYEQGERSCFINEDILYPIPADQFQQTMRDVQDIIANDLSVDMKDLGSDELTQHIGDYTFNYSGLGCYVQYYGLENSSSFSYNDKISSFKNGLRVSLSCSGDAMADYFPSVD